MILGILCGLATGVFSGLVGVGGGIIMIPIMTSRSAALSHTKKYVIFERIILSIAYCTMVSLAETCGD